MEGVAHSLSERGQGQGRERGREGETEAEVEAGNVGGRVVRLCRLV